MSNYIPVRSGLSLQIDKEVLESSTHSSNVSQNFITTTSDKIEILLRDYRNAIQVQKVWITPLGMFVTLLTTLVAADFKTILGFEKNTWQALYLLGLVGCLIWLIITSIRAWNSRGQADIEKVMERLAQGSRETSSGDQAPDLTSNRNVNKTPSSIPHLNINWQHIGHAQTVTAMTTLDGKLFAATRNNKLWMRDPVPYDTPWLNIGYAQALTAMAAVDGKLFATTQDDKLWRRDPIDQDIAWEHIGQAKSVITMTALDGKLFAVTRDGDLQRRNPISQDIPWETIGTAKNIIALTRLDFKLFAVTQDKKLLTLSPDANDWIHIGDTNKNIVAIASIQDTLFAATEDNKLWIGAKS